MSVRLVVKINAAPGKGAELARALVVRCAEVAVEDAGCEQYEIFQSTANPDNLVMLELWEDQAALDAHSQTNAKRPPLFPELREGRGEREDYAYNRIR